MTAGRSIAVQGFNENGGMLLMLGLYAVATALNASLFALVLAFGCLVTLGMTLIYRTHQVGLAGRVWPGFWSKSPTDNIKTS
jgi:hypothetical protein